MEKNVSMVLIWLSDMNRISKGQCWSFEGKVAFVNYRFLEAWVTIKGQCPNGGKWMQRCCLACWVVSERIGMKYPNTIRTIIKSCCLIGLVACGAFSQGLLAQDVPTPEDFFVADGFQSELLYKVPGDFGSWVCMTTGPNGLIVSDQYGKLYQIQPGDNAADTKVSPIDVQVGFAQGLLWAFDSLYVMAHGPKDSPRGLYRVTDADQDGSLDTVKLLREVQGGGEHGPHAIILSPDGQSMYICAGNHTPLPEIQSSRVPQVWQEDNLLERMWDPGGHAVGRLAPAGWVCQVNPEGTHWELVSIGYRNQYDIAFDRNGELFTYDADMEWDIGTPWYRPTRVCHVTDGSEYGWRGGDAKWPTYYPDSLPPVVEIGPGSPTGIVFGTGTDFPAKYQNSLFIADWSFGFIYAVHMEADGGTWKGEKELFCSAPALQVTDMIVYEGDLYFTIGGRRTQSALYRVRSINRGNSLAALPGLTEDQMLRRKLETADLSDAQTADLLWQNLGHADRTIRYAARTRLELMDVTKWQQKLDEATDTMPLLEGLLAYCRVGKPDLQRLNKVMSMVDERIDWARLTEYQQLHLLRVYGLALMRLAPEGADLSEAHAAIAKKFSASYPNQSILLNRELCRLLVRVNEEQVIPKTLQLLADAGTQEEQIHYVMCLRVAKQGWTTEYQRQYLEWFVKSAVFQGGKSFAGYLTNAREQFVAGLPDEDKVVLADVIEAEMTEQDPYAELNARPIVKKWTVQELLPELKKVDLDSRDLQNGKKIFAQAQCYKCHQFAGSGGIVGPDLTILSRRYTKEYLLETLIDPDKEISDQYQATLFELDNGKMVSGRVANLSNDTYMIQENMISPGKLTRINRKNIVDSVPSKVSPMPGGLLDSFTKEEILDLMAYLRSTKISNQ